MLDKLLSLIVQGGTIAKTNCFVTYLVPNLASCMLSTIVGKVTFAILELIQISFRCVCFE